MSFNYQISFSGLKKEDEEIVVKVFNSFDWGRGLDLVSIEFINNHDKYDIKFTSNKEFVYRDYYCDDTAINEVIKHNLYDVFIGKEQLFSSIDNQLYNKYKDTSNIGIIFIDQNNEKWKIELSEYCSINKIVS